MEIRRIIETSRVPSYELRELGRTGLLRKYFPELAASDYVIGSGDSVTHKNVYYHTLQVLDHIAGTGSGPILRWAAVLHDLGKPGTQAWDPKSKKWTFHNHEIAGSKLVEPIMRSHLCPTEWIQGVEKLVYYHMRPVTLIKEPVTDSAVRRFLTDTGEYWESLIKLAGADITSRHRDQYLGNINSLMESIRRVQERDRWDNCNPVLNGTWIIENIGLTSVNQVTSIKNHLKTSILSAGTPNTPEALRGPLEEIMKTLGIWYATKG